MATTATPSASRLRALTDVTNIEKNAAPQQAKPSRTPAPKVSLGGSDSVELFFDAAETPRVTQTEGGVPPARRTRRASRRRLFWPQPGERLLTNDGAEEALTAAWIAAQTAEIEALRRAGEGQRHEKRPSSRTARGPTRRASSARRAGGWRGTAPRRCGGDRRCFSDAAARRRAAARVPRAAGRGDRGASSRLRARVQARTALTALGASITLQTDTRDVHQGRPRIIWSAEWASLVGGDARSERNAAAPRCRQMAAASAISASTRGTRRASVDVPPPGVPNRRPTPRPTLLLLVARRATTRRGGEAWPSSGA